MRVFIFKNYLTNKNNNDIKSREILICSYQRLIIKIAKKYTSDENILLDLIQIGNIALIKCLESFKENYNVRLGTYAYLYINQQINRNFQQQKYSYLYDKQDGEYKFKMECYIKKYFLYDKLYMKKKFFLK